MSTLLRAWRTVIDRAARSGVARELVIVGDGPLRTRLERTIHDLELSDCARITGFLPRTDVIHQLQQASVFALPVRTQLAGLNPEGLGLASRGGCLRIAVIVGDSGGAPETVQDGDTGFVVPSGDHRRLADRLSLLLDNPRLAQEMGPAADASCARSSAPSRLGRRCAKRLTFEAASGAIEHRPRVRYGSWRIRPAPVSTSRQSPTKSWRSSPTSSTTPIGSTR